MERRGGYLTYLAACSAASLENIHLKRLADAACARRELWEALDRWVEGEAEARLVAKVREGRDVKERQVTEAA